MLAPARTGGWAGGGPNGRRSLSTRQKWVAPLRRRTWANKVSTEILHGKRLGFKTWLLEEGRFIAECSLRFRTTSGIVVMPLVVLTPEPEIELLNSDKPTGAGRGKGKTQPTAKRVGHRNDGGKYFPYTCLPVSMRIVRHTPALSVCVTLARLLLRSFRHPSSASHALLASFGLLPQFSIRP